MVAAGGGLAFMGGMWMLAYIALGSYDQRWAKPMRPVLKWAGAVALVIGLILITGGLIVGSSPS